MINTKGHIDPDLFGPRGQAHLMAVGSGNAQTGAAILSEAHPGDQHLVLSKGAADSYEPSVRSEFTPPSRGVLERLVRSRSH